MFKTEVSFTFSAVVFFISFLAFCSSIPYSEKATLEIRDGDVSNSIEETNYQIENENKDFVDDKSNGAIPEETPDLKMRDNAGPADTEGTDDAVEEEDEDPDDEDVMEGDFSDERAVDMEDEAEADFDEEDDAELEKGQYDLERADPERRRQPRTRLWRRPTSRRRRRGNRQSTCNGIPYDPTSLMCCENNIVLRKGPNSRCCDGESYNPDNRLCCDENLRLKPRETYRCCRGVSYDSSIRRCCWRSGEVRPISQWTFWC